jgi:hypothetical protein
VGNKTGGRKKRKKEKEKKLSGRLPSSEERASTAAMNDSFHYFLSSMLTAFAVRQVPGHVILESSELASMDFRNYCCRRCSFLARRQRGEVAVIRTGFRVKLRMTWVWDKAMNSQIPK